MHHFRFCPVCGTGLARKPLAWEPERQELTCESCGFIFWQNAKPTSTAVIEDEKGQVLLVRRAFDPGKGLWDLPGGFVELAEHPEEAVKREAREELNMEIAVREFLGVFIDRYGAEGDYTFNMYYRCHVVSGKPHASSDVAEARWFTSAELPERMAFRNNEEALNAWLQRKGLKTKYKTYRMEGM